LQRNLQQIAQAAAAASLPDVCRARIRARRRLPCRFRHEERNAELHEGEATQLRNPEKNAKPVSLGRHKRCCTICAHEQKEEIEQDFVAWRSPIAIAEEYGLADRISVYRHARAFGLFEKRKRNVRAALERIIEKSGDVDLTASAVVAAIQTYAKINAQG